MATFTVIMLPEGDLASGLCNSARIDALTPQEAAETRFRQSSGYEGSGLALVTRMDGPAFTSVFRRETTVRAVEA